MVSFFGNKTNFMMVASNKKRKRNDVPHTVETSAVPPNSLSETTSSPSKQDGTSQDSKKGKVNKVVPDKTKTKKTAKTAKTARSKGDFEEGSIFGKNALVRPTQESFKKAFDEYMECRRQSLEKMKNTKRMNPFIFLERVANEPFMIMRGL